MQFDPGQEKNEPSDGGVEVQRLALEMLERFGNEEGADTLVPITSAHVEADYLALGDEGAALSEHFASAGGRFAVPASLGPASVDMGGWESFGIPSEFARSQMALCESLVRLGGMRSWTSVPYQVCNFPNSGEAVAWADPCAVLYANSVFGCRANVAPAGLDIACAILGRAPGFGMLAEGNDAAHVVFTVPKDELRDIGYGLLGYLVGKGARGRVPILEGLPRDVTSDDIKHFAAAASSAAPVNVVKIVGVTPGAGSLQKACQGGKPETISVSKSDLEEVENELSQTDEDPDLVALGAPQLSASELGLLARLLRGRRARHGTRVYAYTSPQAFEMASMSGILAEIEASGCAITWGTDADVSPLKAMGFNLVMTDSVLLARTIHDRGEQRVRFSSLREIIRAATV